MKHLNVAVLGTGFIGPVHVESLKRAGVIVKGILGSSLEKSQAAAKDLGLETGYGNLEEIFADDAVDAVHIATPNRLHFEQVSAVLKAGKHVLCEKPLAMTSAESQQLVELAKQSNLAAGVAYNIRFYPLCQELRARIQSGEFGEIYHATGSYVQDWLLKPTDYNWRVLAEDGGELRAVADIGTHWLDLIQFIVGKKITEVCADLQTVHEQRIRPLGQVETFSGKNSQQEQATEEIEINTEDAGNILFRFSDKSKGILHVSQTTAGRKNCLRFEVAGATQSASWNSEAPNELWIGQRDQANQLFVRDPALMTEQAAQCSNYPGGHNEGFPDTFKQLCKAFYGYIAAGDLTSPPPFPTFADGHYEIMLCEAILRSHREQRWVQVIESK